MQKNNFSVFFLFLFCATIFAQDSFHEVIEALNIKSLSWIDEDWPHESYGDFIKRTFEYQLHMQAFKKRKTAFKVLKTSPQTACFNACLDIETIQDLQLLSGKEPHQTYLGELIDRTKTEFGKVYFYEMLATPITQIDLLQKRQAIIRYLLEHEDNFQQFETIFQKLHDHENMILSLWQQDGLYTLVQKKIFNIPFMYRLNQKLNKVPSLLELKSLVGHQDRLLFLMATATGACLLPVFGFGSIAKQNVPDWIKRWVGSLGYGGRVLGFISNVTPADYKPYLALIGGGLSAMLVKEDLEWIKENFIGEKYLHWKMIEIASFLKAIQQLEPLVSTNQICSICPATASLKKWFDEAKNNKELQILFELCQTNTFTGQGSFLSHQGRVLTAYHLLYQIKETLVPLLSALGEFDAYCSCARLYKEFAHKPVHFSFVEYQEADRPIIVLNDFWNPFINKDGVVTNTLALNQVEKRDCIITGPNAAGKSTIIKAIPVNLILAQTIGLAAADKMIMTPFSTIATYLNITDDILAGNSLFKEQVLRAQQIIDFVQNCKPDEFSFIALDEIFNGTSSKESVAAAYSVAHYLAQFKNNITLIATHFPLLTELEKIATDFENYKVSVLFENGLIKYPYKLEKGISHQHIALDILKQEGFDSTIIAQASALLHQL